MRQERYAIQASASPRNAPQENREKSYSMTTMGEALKRPGISKGVDAFKWQETPGALNPHLSARLERR